MNEGEKKEFLRENKKELCQRERDVYINFDFLKEIGERGRERDTVVSLRERKRAGCPEIYGQPKPSEEKYFGAKFW